MKKPKHEYIIVSPDLARTIRKDKKGRNDGVFISDKIGGEWCQFKGINTVGNEAMRLQLLAKLYGFDLKNAQASNSALWKACKKAFLVRLSMVQQRSKKKKVKRSTCLSCEFVANKLYRYMISEWSTPYIWPEHLYHSIDMHNVRPDKKFWCFIYECTKEDIPIRSEERTMVKKHKLPVLAGYSRLVKRSKYYVK